MKKKKEYLPKIINFRMCNLSQFAIYYKPYDEKILTFCLFKCRMVLYWSKRAFNNTFQKQETNK